MPIKKKPMTATPAKTITPKIPPKKNAGEKPAKLLKKTAKAKTDKVELGPFPDPASYAGAHEKATSVLGQVWRFEVVFSSNTKGVYWFNFQEASTKTSGWIWRQCGAVLVFENAAGFARYTGRLQDKEASGTGGNDDGTTWTWTATLSEPRKTTENVRCDSTYQAPH
jgi:hypothetical protein